VCIVGDDPARADWIFRALRDGGVATEIAPPGTPPFSETRANGGGSVAVLDGAPSAAKLRAIADATLADPSLTVLVLGPLAPNVDVLVTLASGASGYLPPDVPAGTLLRAVQALTAGEVVLPPSISTALVRGLRHSGGIVVERLDGQLVVLTNREWEVLVLLRQARTTAEIARRFVVSQGTVRTHIAAILRKLGAGDRAALAGDAVMAGAVLTPRRGSTERA
jgi:DNA-binding NarL/FixJ family response regulator